MEDEQKSSVDTTALPPDAHGIGDEIIRSNNPNPVPAITLSDTSTTESVSVSDSVPVTINPLLQRARMPGEDHRLPSWGIFYNSGELDATSENGEVHIHPLTTMDEINLASPAKLYSGEGITETIKNCIPSIKKPELLLAQDVDFLMLCMRKVSYGPIFEFTRNHPSCTAIEEGEISKESEYQANLNNVIAASKVINVEDVSNGKYSLTLNGTGQSVKFEPLRFKDYIKLMQAHSHAARKELNPIDQKNIILDQLSGMIVAVDEVTQRSMIREWLEVISSSHVKAINDHIENMSSWGVNTVVEVKCKDCGEHMEVDLPTSPLMLYS